MGQAVSRRLVPRLERMRARYDDLVRQEAIAEVERRRTEAVAGMEKRGLGRGKGKTGEGGEMPSVSSTLYTDPNARLTGFTRGAQYQEFLDERRRAQLEQGRAVGGGDPEMPPDLVEFLSDAGPLQKSVNEGLTSDRLKKKKKKLKESGSDLDDYSLIEDATPRRRAGPRRGDVELEEAAAASEESRGDADVGGEVVQPPSSSDRLTDAEITNLLLDHQNDRFGAGAEVPGDSSSSSLPASPMLELVTRHVAVPTVALRDRHATSEEDQDDSEDTPYVAVWPGDVALGRYGRVVYPPQQQRRAADVGAEGGPASAAAGDDEGGGNVGGGAEDEEEVEVGERIEAVAMGKGKDDTVLEAVRRRADAKR